MKQFIENTLYFLLGGYVLAIWWTFQQLWDKEGFWMTVWDSVIWPLFWYNVFFT